MYNFFLLIKTIYKKIFIIITIINLCYAANVKTEIKNIDQNKYISLKKFVKNHGIQNYYYPDKNKFWIDLYNNKVIFSENCSYVKVNDNIFQITSPILFYNNSYYISLSSIKLLLNSTSLPDGEVDTLNQVLITQRPDYNLHSININSKSNGSIISIISSQKFDNKSISASINRSTHFCQRSISYFTISMNAVWLAKFVAFLDLYLPSRRVEFPDGLTAVLKCTDY